MGDEAAASDTTQRKNDDGEDSLDNPVISQDTSSQSRRLRNRNATSTSGKDKEPNFDNRFDELKHLILGVQTDFNKKLTGIEQLLESKLSAKIDDIIEDKLSDKLQKCNENEAKIAALEAKVAQLEQMVKTQSKAIKEHKEETKGVKEELSRNLEKLETHGRKLNLRFDGIPEKEGEDCKYIIESVINTDMRLRMRDPIDIAHRVGKSTETRAAPIVARFKTVADKLRVLENANRARHRHVYISMDVPLAVTQRREYLSKALKEVKQHDRSAKLVHDKLKIGPKYYTVETINTANIQNHSHDQETDTQHRFYGYLSPMSNFYQCGISLKGLKFTSAEQAYQFARARQRGERALSRRIYNQANPAVIKRISNVMKSSTEEQKQKDREIMEAVVFAKFDQNAELEDKLLQTGTKTMIECNPYDAFFSCGLRMNDPRLDQLDYPGKNILGTILEDVRSQLLDSE